MAFSLFSGSKKEIQSLPHPELIPLSDEECAYPVFEREPMLSARDYSPEEIERAKIAGRVPCDMMEYCHNNGINWELVSDAHHEIKQRGW